jgi:hypothetical protein
MRSREEAVAKELKAGGLKVEPAKASLLTTRREIDQGWRSVSEILLSQGQPELAADVRRFAQEMPPPQTEKEWLAARLSTRTRDPPNRSGLVR